MPRRISLGVRMGIAEILSGTDLNEEALFGDNPLPILPDNSFVVPNPKFPAPAMDTATPEN